MSSQIGVGPSSHVDGVLLRKEETHVWGRRGHVTMEAEIEVLCLQKLGERPGAHPPLEPSEGSVVQLTS
jgi:hypothetical protein